MFEHGQFERFTQNIEAAIGSPSSVGKTAGEQYRQIGKLLPAYLRQADAVDRSWHDNIGKQKIEFDALLKMAQRLGSVLGPHNAVTELLEQRRRHVRDVAAVLHHQYGALDLHTRGTRTHAGLAGGSACARGR